MVKDVNDLPGFIKLKLSDHLGGDGDRLAMVLNIQNYRQDQFEAGNAGKEILSWMVERNLRITTLIDALADVGRWDLACLVKLATIEGLSREQQRDIETLFKNAPVPQSTLRHWCQQAIPPELLEAVPTGHDSLELLMWLLDRGALRGQYVPLVTVLRQIHQAGSAENRLKQPHIDALLDLLSRCFLGVDASQVKDVEAKATVLTPALMVELWPVESGSSRCSLRGWLVDHAATPEAVLPTDDKDIINLDSVEETTALVMAIREILVSRNVDPNSTLLEFVLPCELMDRAIHCWMDDFDDHIGPYLLTVLRSRERLRNKSMQLGWAQSWEKLTADTTKQVADMLWWFNAARDYRLVRRQLEQGVCIALGVVPECATQDNTNTMRRLLHSGAPAILWPCLACDDPDLLAREIPNKLDGPIDQLPQLLRAYRRDLWEAQDEQHIGYHLNLLWDDANRRLPKPAYGAPQ